MEAGIGKARGRKREMREECFEEGYNGSLCLSEIEGTLREEKLECGYHESEAASSAGGSR